MMVCRPLTCGVLSNTLSVWGRGWVCWAEAKSALRAKGRQSAKKQKKHKGRLKMVNWLSAPGRSAAQRQARHCSRQHMNEPGVRSLHKALTQKARRGGSKPRKKRWRMCELTWHWAHAALEEDERQKTIKCPSREGVYCWCASDRRLKVSLPITSAKKDSKTICSFCHLKWANQTMSDQLLNKKQCI